MAIEIVSFPMNSMVMFHSYVTVYQRVTFDFEIIDLINGVGVSQGKGKGG